MHIALLGAGHIGQTIARLLAATGDDQVTLIDRNPQALARAAGPHTTTRQIDTDDQPALLAALRGHDAVVNALPYHLAASAAPPPPPGRCAAAR